MPVRRREFLASAALPLLGATRGWSLTSPPTPDPAAEKPLRIRPVPYRQVRLDGREVQVAQGTSAWGSSVKLYFDKQSGLLVRQVRYTNVPVGRVPTQVDYADYRDVSGVKMPFRWTVTWVDGRSTFELSDVKPNAQIDAAKFAKPVPPTPLTKAATP